MGSSAGMVWFRRDLRLDDNPAWAAATSEHDLVTALFVVDPVLYERASSRRISRLFGDVKALDASLTRNGGRLLVRIGDPRVMVPAEAKRLDISAIHVNRDVTPYATDRDMQVETALQGSVVEWVPEWGTMTHEPGLIRTKAGTLSQVFTPFFRVWERTPWTPWPTPGDAKIANDPGDSLPEHQGVYPLLEGDIGEAALPGEQGAQARLALAVERADSYAEDRNTPSILGTSQLSIDLRFGTLSPRFIARVVGESSPGRAALVRQLAWRDWYAHMLYATPSLVEQPMKPQYAKIKWRSDDNSFLAWKNGLTGFPLVDAGMRQLKETGWMHNRVRMVTASFLVKNLLIDWRRGERYFRHVLLDADISQNVGNWQWVAGTGPDASPYNRVFNPILQSKRFDENGAYIRRWVPELAGLDSNAIHEPWEVGPLELAAAGVELGIEYPAPIVDLAFSRKRVLEVYGATKN
ncbi:MAG: deoxyribodipyrimidine photo-lyase [Acidimicrobiales bacterium]